MHNQDHIKTDAQFLILQVEPLSSRRLQICMAIESSLALLQDTAAFLIVL